MYIMLYDDDDDRDDGSLNRLFCLFSRVVHHYYLRSQMELRNGKCVHEHKEKEKKWFEREKSER